MNKGELINAVAAASNVNQADAKVTVEKVSEVIRDALFEGKEVTIPGVGKLKVTTRPGRAGRNPKTGEAIQIPQKRVVKFHPSTFFEAEMADRT